MGTGNEDFSPAAVLARAEGGSVMDKTLAGMYLLYGMAGTPVDLPLAYRFLSEAAKAGAPRAKTHLGIMLGWGIGADRAPSRAIELLRSAADAGEEEARVRLAQLHLAEALALFTSLDAEGYYEGYDPQHEAVIALVDLERLLGRDAEEED